MRYAFHVTRYVFCDIDYCVIISSIIIPKYMLSQKSLLVSVTKISLVFLLVVFILVFSIVFGYASQMNKRVLGEAETAVDAPQAVITINEADWVTQESDRWLDISSTKGYAPFPVFFSGLESSPQDKIVEYEWNFGDPTYSYDGNQNIFSGFNAAHVYEEPGIYTATLKVKNKDGVWSEFASTTIEVMLSAGNTYYIDSDLGDDSYSGLCRMSDGNGCGPWQTATKVFNNIADTGYGAGDKVLFNRDQTFKMDTAGIGGDWKIQSVMFGAYGSGAKPIIKYTGSNDGSFLVPGVGWINIKFVDLIFDFKSDTNQSQGLVVNTNESKGWLFLRVEAYEPQNGFWNFSGTDSATTTDIFMIDSTVTQEDTFTIAQNQIVVTANSGNIAILNSQFDNAGSNIASFGAINKAIIADNIFSRPAFNGSALKVIGSQSLGHDFPAKDILIADNKFLGWIDSNTNETRYNKILIQFGPESYDYDLSLENIVFERNILTNFEGGIQLSNISNIAIKNNLFVTSVLHSDNKGIIIGNNDAFYDSRPISDLKIVGNDFIYKFHTNNGFSDVVTSVFTINSFNGTSTSYGNNHKDIDIYNNIIYLADKTKPRIIEFINNDSELLNEVISDRNIFYVDDDLAQGKYFYIGSSKYSFSNWKTKTNNDNNSQLKNPNFIKVPSVPKHSYGHPTSLLVGLSEVNEYLSNLKIQSSSPAIDSGTAFSVDLYYDFNKNIRPMGSGFDIGAFESYYRTGLSCDERWSCEDWSNCSDGVQIRDCIDSNSCGTTNDKPTETQSCIE